MDRPDLNDLVNEIIYADGYMMECYERTITAQDDYQKAKNRLAIAQGAFDAAVLKVRDLGRHALKTEPAPAAPTEPAEPVTRPAKPGDDLPIAPLDDTSDDDREDAVDG